MSENYSAITPLKELTSRYHQALHRYQKALPANEYQALIAWLTAFYPYQLDWLLDSSDMAICNKSRQIGMSHTTSGLAVLWGAFHGELTTVISIGQLESDEVLEKSRRHAKVLAALGSGMARQSRDNRSEIIFSSGGKILALPSSGGRSFTGNVFLDEFSFQEHASKVWDAAAAVTLLGGKLRVSSTPNGVGNDFHNLWKRAGIDPSWRRYEIPIEAAQAQGYPADLNKCWSLAKHDERLFNQMFRGQFLDGELQYIPSSLIDACSTDDLQTSDGAYYAGLDIGKTVDLTALCVLRKTKGLYVVQHIETQRRTDQDALDAMVDRCFKTFQLRRLTVDATGMGAFPAERMQKRFGRSKVEPLVFTSQSKEDLATALYIAFVQHQIRIPKTRLVGCGATEPPKLREDIATIRRTIQPSGRVVYEAPHTDEGHADRAWALAMALHAAMTAPTYANL